MVYHENGSVRTYLLHIYTTRFKNVDIIETECGEVIINTIFDFDKDPVPTRIQIVIPHYRDFNTYVPPTRTSIIIKP